MPVSIPRLRIWFAVTALAAIAVVAGFYVRARLDLRSTLKNLPGKVGINIQQSSDGFTLSKSEGGRTLFTIHASNATQFKQGGRAELRDVNIVVYGRSSDRFDQISGKHFDYDQQSGMVVSTGEVEIDLQGNSEGQKMADQATPRETRNPIHVRTQGMVFNQKTGMAHTDGLVDFNVPQAAGTARGADYDSQKNELTLRSEVNVQTAGAEPTHIVAAHGTISKDPRVLTMEQVTMSGQGRTMLANHAVMDLAPDNSIQNIHATGDVRLSNEGGLRLHAPRGEMTMGDKSLVQTVLFTGGVDFESTTQSSTGHSGEMLMHFISAPKVSQPKVSQLKVSAPKQEPGVVGNSTAGNSAAGNPKQGSSSSTQLDTIYATHGSILRQAPRADSTHPQAMTISSEAMTFKVNEGRLLSAAQTEGPGVLTMTGAGQQNAGEQTIINAQHFTAEFGDQNRLRTVHGTGAVRAVSKVPAQPDKVSTSQTMVAEFTPAGEMASVVQEGNFHFKEAQSSKDEPGGRTSTAARATYLPQDDSLTLLGDPRVVDGGMTLTADSIRMLRRSGESFAVGNVKTTYSELAVQPNGALLATADPVHVTAHAMNAKQLTGMAHYTGSARLWQNSNIVEAPAIDFDQKARTIVAQGDKKHPVSSVFLQVDDKGKSSTMLVTAPRLNYADNERQARYSGGVTARGEDGGVMTAGRADVFLNAASQTRTPGPSQLDHILAVTNVLVQQQERRAVGEQLLYTASTGAYVITGGAPELSDPVNGTVRGDSLTFYSHDDRVVVEGKGSTRAVTHTHVSH
jgi:lipopolysaccharide export system protein LptA